MKGARKPPIRCEACKALRPHHRCKGGAPGCLHCDTCGTAHTDDPSAPTGPEIEILDCLASAIADEPDEPDAGRQYFASDGADYGAALRLVSIGLARVTDQRTRGRDPWVCIAATDRGLRFIP